MIPFYFQGDAEDIVSLLLFIDQALPLVNTDEEESREAAITVFKTREALHDALGELGTEVPRGVNPCPS